MGASSQAKTIISSMLGSAAQTDIDRQCRERDQAADQPRRDEGAMTRDAQRILPRRGVHQAVDIIADRCEQAHVPVHVR